MAVATFSVIKLLRTCSIQSNIHFYLISHKLIDSDRNKHLAFHSLCCALNLDKDASHVVGSASIAIGRVDVFADDLVEHLFDDFRVLLGSLSGLNALGEQVYALLGS